MSEQATELSLELFSSGFFSVEIVVLAITESQGIQADFIPRIETGFCSGVFRIGGMCGTASGAIMSINLIVGRNVPAESLEVGYAFTQN
jgi:hypothetical protein